MSDFGLLSLEHVNNNIMGLRALRVFGRSCMGTDFVNLLGGYVTDQGAFYWLKDKKAGIRPSVYYIDDLGTGGLPKTNKCENSTYCIRPIILLNSINKYNVVSDASNDYMEIEYGEFPQSAVSGNKAKMLESLYSLGTLNKTGKLYTINDPGKNKSDSRPFVPKSIAEYELSSSRYVRITSESLNIGKLSTGEAPKAGEAYWVKVEPIKWIVDKFSKICISRCALMTGVPFNYANNYSGVFNDSDIAKYFDFYFSDEINSLEVPKPKEKKKSKVTGKNNTTPYGFTYTNASDEDIIKGAILSNVAVFLHGKSSDGKSARVQALDPDCEIIYLRNATPESLNGKSAYNSNTGEMIDIPPTWYKRIMEKCEKYPDRIHIVFLDEITNALHSIQGMAFNIVLNKEVNGIWKLPDNVRIVAAGNDLEDSMAANTLVEPLFNRFAHVYINTTAKSWLKWALNSTEGEYLPYEGEKKNPKIHPAVIAYIQSRGDSALRTTFNGKTPNADPRKWELASRILYTTGRPMMIKSLVGNEIAKDFCTFCKLNTLSIADVIEGRYNIEEIRKYDVSKKSLVVVAMSLCEEAHLAIVRSFIKRLEPELVSQFDSLWLQNNPDGADLLSSIIDGE